jgi:hypothetical protein
MFPRPDFDPSKQADAPLRRGSLVFDDQFTTDWTLVPDPRSQAPAPWGAEFDGTDEAAGTPEASADRPGRARSR